MRKKSFLIAMLLSVFAVMTTACHKDDDKDNVVTVYSYGITKSEYSSVSTSSDPATISGADEMTAITNAFADAFKTALGVSGTSFPYNGGDTKVIAACKQAEESLKDKTFKGKYTLEVNKTDGATKVIYTWNSPEPEPEPEPEPQTELPEYTLLFYSYGGESGDMYLMENVHDIYEAVGKTNGKVKAVVQNKFSSEGLFKNNENHIEWLKQMSEGYGFSADEWAEKYQWKSFRTVVDPEEDFGEILFKNLDGIIMEEDNIDVGDPDNLTDFIKWAVEKAPAKKYVLAIGSHGKGYIPDEDQPKNKTLSKALFFDEGNDDNNLTVSDLSNAIRRSGIKLEAFFMNCCLMNTVEYQFELKDLTNYLALSTFSMPGLGGDYETLVNGLANSDIETALSDFCKASIAGWDATEDYKYSDMSVTRTSALDAFGAVWKEFTDRLIDAYTNGGDEVKAKINDVTANYTLKVDDDVPSYALTNYAISIAEDAAPEYFPASFVDQLKSSFENCIVESQASKVLMDNDWLISCSIMLGCKNHYTKFEWDGLDDMKALLVGTPYQLDERFVFDDKYLAAYYFYNADGTIERQNNVKGERENLGTWGSTFDETYKALKFDQITGWSRWIEVNEQEPSIISPISNNYDLE